MSRLIAYILNAVRHPHEKLSRGQHQLRYTWELGVHCWRQLLRLRADGMAAELTYRTIFSLIPVVVLGLVVFRVVGGLEDVKQSAETQLFSFFGVPDIPEQEYVVARSDNQADDEPQDDHENQSDDLSDTPVVEAETTEPKQDAIDATSRRLTTAEGGEPVIAPDALVDSNESPPPNDEAENQANERRTQASIRRTLRDAVRKVSSIDFASIGVVGLLLFLYAAVALANSVEYLFNRIFDAPAKRPVHIRLAIHWSIITLGSGLLAISLYLSGQVLDWFGTIGAGSNLKLLLAHSLSLLASWILLFLLYALMPNTHVSVKAAAIGAMVGALLWEAAKFGFQIYVATAVPYSALYGSLGLIPLFLFWIYLTWLIVLFGLILTYTLQTLRGKRFQKQNWADDDLLHGDPDWMLPIMSEVAVAFEKGKSIGQQEIADQLKLSSRIVNQMANKLVENNMLRRVSSGAGEEDSLTLARPAHQISIAEVLALAHNAGPTSDHPAWKTLSDLKKAERVAAEDKTLADVCAT